MNLNILHMIIITHLETQKGNATMKGHMVRTKHNLVTNVRNTTFLVQHRVRGDIMMKTIAQLLHRGKAE